MGADFFLVACPLPIVADGETIDHSRQSALLRQRIDDLSAEVLATLVECFLGGLEIDDVGEWKTAVRDRLEDGLELLLAGGTRQTAVCELGRRLWMFSGGMSSGDTPSEAYDLLWLLADSGILDEPLSTATFKPELTDS